MTERGRPLVIDASAMLDFLLQLRRARHIAALMVSPFARMHAPETIDREVINVLRRRERAGDLDSDKADAVIEDFLSLPVEIHPPRQHLRRVWELRSFLAVGDAYYASLAEVLDATLVTCDEKLARGVAPLGIDVIVP